MPKTNGTGKRAHKAVQRLPLSAALALLVAAAPQSQTSTAAPVGGVALPPRSLYLPSPPAPYVTLLAPAPQPGSLQQAQDMEAVRHAEQIRTAQQIRSAQSDDADESMFAFANVVGPWFARASLPKTAALSAHLRQESAVVNPPLKLAFARPRPFVTDPALHPVCSKTSSNSYPSGHAMVGYLEAYALAAMLPERKDAILARAAQFAANRVICGVHYPSDVEASRTVSLALFGSLLTAPAFQQELAAVQAELRHAAPHRALRQPSGSR